MGQRCDRLVQRCKGAIGVHEGRHALKAPAAVTPVEEERRRGESAAVAALAAEVRPDDSETRGIAERERIQQHAIDETEDCGGSADSQRDDQDTEQIERRIAAEEPQTIREISQKGHIEMDARVKESIGSGESHNRKAWRAGKVSESHHRGM